jgi:hypothetical protein
LSLQPAWASSITLFEDFDSPIKGEIHGGHIVPGYIGNGLLLDDDFDYVKYASSYFPAEGTFEAYIKWYGFIDNDPLSATILGTVGCNANVRNHLEFLIAPADRKPYAVMRHAGGAYSVARSYFPIEFNRWYSVGVSWGSAGLKTYINGELVAYAADFSARSDEPVYVGDYPLDNFWSQVYPWDYEAAFIGVIDEIRVSSKQGDITYNAAATPEASTLLLLGSGLAALGAWRRRRKVAS